MFYEINSGKMLILRIEVFLLGGKTTFLGTWSDACYWSRGKKRSINQ